MSYYYTNSVTIPEYTVRKGGIAMQENAIRAELPDLRISAVIFDEALRFGNVDPKKAVCPPHSHADFEIFFLIEGTMDVHLDSHCRTVKAPAAVILPPRTDHATKTDVPRGYCMYFRPEKKGKSESDRQEKLLAALHRDVTVLPLESDDIFYIEHLADSLHSPTGEGTRPHLVALLFSGLFRRIVEEPPSPNASKHIKYIHAIDLYISAHFNEKLRLTDLARELYLCPKQVARIIRKEYGCTLSDLVARYRIATARALLHSGNDSVEAIAQAVGYEHPNYFYRQFRAATGLTPRQYRKQGTML